MNSMNVRVTAVLGKGQDEVFVCPDPAANHIRIIPPPSFLAAPHPREKGSFFPVIS